MNKNNIEEMEEDEFTISIKSHKKSDIGIDSLFSDRESVFQLSNDLRQALIFELISAIYLNKEKEVDNILSLDLKLFDAFSPEKEYTLNDTDLQDSTEYYPNILSLAVINFPDKYVLKIIKKMSEDKNKLEDLLGFNPKNKNYTLSSIIDNNLKESFGFLRKENLLTEESLYKNLYLHCYREKRQQLLSLLFNPIELDKIIKYKVLSEENINKQYMQIYSILSFMEDLYKNSLLNNNDLKNNVISILSFFKDHYPHDINRYAHYGQTNKDVKKIIINMLGKNIINLTDKEVKSDQDIETIFKLDNKDMEKVYAIRAKDLDKQLAKNTKSAKKMKL